MRAKEFTPGTQDLIIFDIDDTLMHTTAKIKVVKDGQIIRDLSNQEFNNYKLQPGEEFDFGEFRSAEKFRQESKPIVPMVSKLKAILNHAGNAKVIMLTARADFDDKEMFLRTFNDLGIDMSQIHVHRAGNLPGNDSPAYKKAVWVRKYLDTKQYGHVRLYDDSMSNLRVFKELKKEYPQVDFRAIYVGPGGTTQTIEEASYPGNIGAMEVFKFMQKADPEKKELLKKLIAKKDYSRAWELIQDLTGVKLQGKEFSTENFADGKNPGRKGLAKRTGVNCKASVSTLRNVAKNSSGEKQRMAHWCANMKGGRKK
jgi:hypothetical protein